MDNQELFGEEIFPATTPTQEEKTMALLSHILTLAGAFVFLIGGFLPPLIIYLLKKDESNFVSEHAKESLNFQITMAIGFIISFVLMFLIIGVFMMAILGIIELILIIIATIKASEGKLYRYPFNLRIIK
ncbi:MAG: DUF4870 domain-containing protein [Bacteroidetes bacterium]|nr:DUF4870 domain-containing protein [Bacteroidota bacterium]